MKPPPPSTDTQSIDSQLNISDRNAIDALCIAFGCTASDVYTAVAMGGDRMRDVRRFLAALTEPRPEQLDPVSRGASLPPIWARRRA